MLVHLLCFPLKAILQGYILDNSHMSPLKYSLDDMGGTIVGSGINGR